jgi:hydroxyacylglutathione hydrolase
VFLHQFFVKGLGHASYLLGDPDVGVAAVIDPRRDVDAYISLARDEGLVIGRILETHVHNDYVSGAEELRRRTDATVHASAEGGLVRPHLPLRDRDELMIGSLRIRVLATPGHTPDHVSYLVADLARSDDDWVLFAGGALLVGTAARPDLLGGPVEARLAAAELYRSITDRIAPLPDWIELYPTHGTGSLCGTGIGGKRWSTIGYERRHNPALRQPDVESFTEFILSDQPTVPAHWRRMRRLNQEGATLIDELVEPRPIDAQELAHAAGHDFVVVDGRSPAAFAEAHVPGSLGIALESTFGTWVGSMVPTDREIVLILEQADDLDEALVQLRRAGFDRVPGYLLGGFDTWRSRGLPVERLDTLTPDALALRIAAGGAHVVDVREASEYRSGHVPGAILLPTGALPSRLADLPPAPLALICASGHRSTIAASFLRRAGIEAVETVVGGTDGYQPLDMPGKT